MNYQKALKVILTELINPENRCLNNPDEIDITGHRLIHGGEECIECTQITPELKEKMEMCMPLAPLHYPSNMEGIEALAEYVPHAKQFGVFDTAFHHTIPEKAFLYGIEKSWYTQQKIRRYGFHGTSHKYAFQRACQVAKLPMKKSRIITCHLGNGSSVAAIKNGKSVDTSMGMTPVEGLLMGTRSGDIDAGVLIHLQESEQKTPAEIQEMINKTGGLLGLSGISSDYRQVEKAALDGNSEAKSALDVFHYRVKKYIGAYMAVLGGLDALVFTGGIGENSSRARQEICKGLEYAGIRLSEKKNNTDVHSERIISSGKSTVKALVIPANEELMIAREIYAVAKRK